MQCRRETRMEHKVYQICFYGFLSLRHSVVGHVSTNHLNKSTCNAQPIVKKETYFTNTVLPTFLNEVHILQEVIFFQLIFAGKLS